MNEERFVKILDERFSSFEDKVGDKFSDIEDRVNDKFSDFENKVDEKFSDFESKVNNKFSDIENKFNEKFSNFEDKFDDKLSDLENKFDKKLKENNEIIIKRVDEKLMDHGAYFEHKYGEQISAIWTKLQVMDDRKDLDHEEIKNLEEKFNQNNLELMAHDMRISKLEEKISS